ncbi:hypothetical protein K438DRAFT_1960373 [Mycena galopus ATCC 62051]|nr:hypothetical protein K438DRAFT_1960373 [Mycena galopus ATCC 62051]
MDNATLINTTQLTFAEWLTPHSTPFIPGDVTVITSQLVSQSTSVRVAQAALAWLSDMVLAVYVLRPRVKLPMDPASIAAQAFLLQHNHDEISVVIKDMATMSGPEAEIWLQDCEFASPCLYTVGLQITLDSTFNATSPNITADSDSAGEETLTYHTLALLQIEKYGLSLPAWTTPVGAVGHVDLDQLGQLSILLDANVTVPLPVMRGDLENCNGYVTQSEGVMARHSYVASGVCIPGIYKICGYSIILITITILQHSMDVSDLPSYQGGFEATNNHIEVKDSKGKKYYLRLWLGVDVNKTDNDTFVHLTLEGDRVYFLRSSAVFDRMGATAPMFHMRDITHEGISKASLPIWDDDGEVGGNGPALLGVAKLSLEKAPGQWDQILEWIEVAENVPVCPPRKDNPFG